MTLPEPNNNQADLTNPNLKIDMWGPKTSTQVEGVVLAAPKNKKPWNAWDILWFVFALIATQVALIPFLVILAVSQYHLELDTPEGVNQLPEALTKVATHGFGLVFAVVFQWIAFVSVPVWLSYRKGQRSIAKDFGFIFKRYDLLWGFCVAVSMQILLAGVGWILRQTSIDLSNADNTTQVTDQTGLALLFMIVVATIGAPLTEELLFRGFIMRACLRSWAKLDLADNVPGLTDKYHSDEISSKRRRIGTVGALVFSALLFGSLHAQTATIGSVIVIAQTGFLGLVFAIVALRTRRIGITVCAHFFFNSISVGLALWLASS